MIHATAILSQPASDSTTTSTTGSGVPTSQSLDTMFLQLLIAQMQNQDPTQPVDPTQFVTQLAQFSELSQVTQINQLLQEYVAGASGSGGSGGTGGTSNSSTPTGTQAGSSQPPYPTAPVALPSPNISAAEAGASSFTSALSSSLKSRIEGVF